MNLAARLCTDSILNVSFSVCGAQTTQVYSKIFFYKGFVAVGLGAAMEVTL